MTLILDSDIVSLLRRPERMPQLYAWRRSVEERSLFLTVVTPGEIEHGIHRQRRVNPPFARTLSEWAQGIERAFADRILPFDAAAATLWGRLTVERGYETADLLIAAIALARDAAVVTRNTADFAATGVRLVNPLAG